jgi:hypothetical protein
LTIFNITQPVPDGYSPPGFFVPNPISKGQYFAKSLHRDNLFSFFCVPRTTACCKRAQRNSMKKKTLRRALLAGLFCTAIAGVFIYRAWNRPHRSAAMETAVVINAPQLAAAFEQDEASANKQYLGQAVQVSGTIDGVSVNQQNKPVLVLKGTDISSVQCSLLQDMPGLKKGDLVVIKGFCSGYLTDVVMDRCVVTR